MEIQAYKTHSGATENKSVFTDSVEPLMMNKLTFMCQKMFEFILFWPSAELRQSHLEKPNINYLLS